MQGSVHPDLANVASVFERLLPKDGRGGAALAVLHDGELVADLWGGTRDDVGSPFTGDTLALSFSTTKGVASTLLHVLAAKGLVDYDAKVARYWPEFAANGKGAITVRHVLCHEAGLYSIRAITDDARDMLDWDGMLRRLERATPLHAPGEANGYHGLTYGFLVGAIIERVTGKSFSDALRDELAAPLGLSGCYVGLPGSEMHRRAKLVRRDPLPPPSSVDVPVNVKKKRSSPLLRGGLVAKATELVGHDPKLLADAILPRGIARFDWNDEDVVRACIPAAGGMFDARSLARVYGLLANGGELDGTRLLSPNDVARLATIQNRRRDRVLPLPMQWRLGYHRVLTFGGFAPEGFGHFGFGGSGAFCDPSRRLSVGFVLNHGIGTPLGDSRIWTLGGAILRAIDVRRARRFVARLGA